jgi:hypothetical protein
VTLLLCAFGAYSIVLFIRLIIPQVIPVTSFFKYFLVLLGSFSIAWLSFPHNGHELVVYGIAGAGAASLIHRLGRLAIATADLVIVRFHRERPRP